MSWVSNFPARLWVEGRSPRKVKVDKLWASREERKEMLRILSHPDLPTPQQFPLSRRTSGKKKGTKQGTDE